MAFLTPKCSIRKTIFVIILLILIGAGGGLILWMFLPESQRQSLNDVKDGGLPFDYVKGDAPPAEYLFNQCSSGADCCNGLDGLCDLSVKDILYAGIHNAQSTAQDGFYIAPNHQYNVQAALDYGYRALNFDIGLCNEGVMSLVHGNCKLGTTDPAVAFTGVQTWLDANPNEVVIIPLEINNDAGGDLPDVDLGKLYNLFLDIPGFTERMYQFVKDTEWPTLRELVALDQRIILFFYNAGIRCATSACPPGFNDWFSLTGESKFNYMAVEEFDNKATACNITRGRTKGPFYAINTFMTIPSRDISTNTLNTKAFLENHIEACSQANDGLDVNVVFVDFWSEGDLPEVVQLHNSRLVTQFQNANAQR